MSVRLRITEAHHGHNAFWDLGLVTHEVPIQVLFDSLPDGACPRDAEGRSTHAEACYIADLLDASGDLVDDREIPREVAQALLDEPIEVLRERFRKWLWETHGATG